MSVSIFTNGVLDGLNGSKLVDSSVDRYVGRISTISKPFLELQLSRMDRIQSKTGLKKASFVQ